ncbi:hypothetical protein BDN72DRAFT_906292 [Pluteus cervinus]|uniref:Uncharacterized protein n=1 Tax=Pluteus cervinus TaxID=181527 RepID=A0ACD3A206_9AGAR|nr:hypothetical protein BDN72DRAFT_906292 [Pluteus cervinus]
MLYVVPTIAKVWAVTYIHVQLLFALLLPLANAAIGPVGDLPITNVEIAPDGVSRP